MRRLFWLPLFLAAAGDRSPNAVPGESPPVPAAAQTTNSHPIKAQSKPNPRPIPPTEAHALAEEDTKGLSPVDLPFTVWFWMGPEPRDEDFRTLSFVLNLVSRAGAISRPLPVAKKLLARVDVRQYAPRDGDLKDWLTIREQFQFDPTFSELITGDQVTNLTAGRETASRTSSGKRWEKRPVPPYTASDGKTYDFEWVEVAGGNVKAVDAKQIAVVRRNAADCEPAMSRLQALTRSQAPVISWRYFAARALSTVRSKDDDVFNTLYGGLYYDLTGIHKSQVKGKSDLDEFLKKLRIDHAGLEDTDSRIGIKRSDITGNPRMVEAFGTRGARVSQAMPWVVITNDIKDTDADIGTNWLLNLVQARFAAKEIIATKTNGFNFYVLFDSQGKLLTEADIHVATDNLIPKPFRPVLQPAISCLRCHGPHDGWQPMRNDAARLLDKRRTGGLDVFGDTFNARQSIPETLDLLSAYAGDFDEPLAIARNNFAKAALRACGPDPKAKDQAGAARTACQAVTDAWQVERWDQVGAKEAKAALARENLIPSGVQQFPGPGQTVWGRKLPDGKIAFEDPRIADLLSGGKINRLDWDLIQVPLRLQVEKK